MRSESRKTCRHGKALYQSIFLQNGRSHVKMIETQNCDAKERNARYFEQGKQERG